MTDELKVAMIATSASAMSDGEPTGLWIEELTTPYYALRDAGITVDLFSIVGGDVPIDPRSQQEKGENDESVERYLEDADLKARLASTKSVDAVDAQRYDAIFLPGGHGTMWDYPESEALARLVSAAYAQGRVVAAVCHGPAGLVNAEGPDGAPLVKGRKVAGFTNSEEVAVGLKDAVPFLLEDRLKALGADYRKAGDFEPFAVRDGRLITGQNPPSAAVTVRHVIDALSERASSTA